MTANVAQLIAQAAKLVAANQDARRALAAAYGLQQSK